MKFIVSSAYLLKQISAINGVITTNPVVPILENFLFEISDGTLTITASDLKTSMITELQVEAKEDGSIAIPAKILLETLRNLPDQPVTFSIDDSTYSIEINSDNGRYKLAGESATDFPRIPTISDGYSASILSSILARAINNTLIATSSDDLRPAMTGVYVKLDKTDTTFVATDSHRLIRYRRTDIAAVDITHSMIIPRKALALLKATLSSTEPTDVSLEFNASNAFFNFSNIKMACRLIDERFPDYEKVIPLNNDNHIIVDRSEILSSLRRIAIYANKTTYQIKMTITGNQLTISAEDLEFSNEANERLTCEHDGEDIEIGFNGKFLIELIGNMHSEEVTFKLNKPSNAGMIFPNEKEEVEDTMILVMPVMLNNRV